MERAVLFGPGSIPVRAGQQPGGRLLRPTGRPQQDGRRDGSSNRWKDQTGSARKPSRTTHIGSLSLLVTNVPQV